MYLEKSRREKGFIWTEVTMDVRETGNKTNDDDGKRIVSFFYILDSDKSCPDNNVEKVRELKKKRNKNSNQLRKTTYSC